MMMQTRLLMILNKIYINLLASSDKCRSLLLLLRLYIQGYIIGWVTGLYWTVAGASTVLSIALFLLLFGCSRSFCRYYYLLFWPKFSLRFPLCEVKEAFQCAMRGVTMPLVRLDDTNRPMKLDYCNTKEQMLIMTVNRRRWVCVCAHKLLVQKTTVVYYRRLKCVKLKLERRKTMVISKEGCEV